MLIGRRAGRPEGRRTRPARRSAPRNGSRGRSPQTFALSSAASSPAGVSGDGEHVLLKLKCALSGPARGVERFHLTSRFCDRRPEVGCFPFAGTCTADVLASTVLPLKRKGRRGESPRRPFPQVCAIRMKRRLAVSALRASVESYGRLRNRRTPPSLRRRSLARQSRLQSA